MPSERELDLALANMVQEAEFLQWLISHTKFAGRDVELLSCRANHPWGTHPFVFTDPMTGEESLTNRQSETDVLLIVIDDIGRRIGIHIENKLASGRFTRFQEEMYSQRAAFWRGNQRYGEYEDYDTVLIAPWDFYQRHPVQAHKFGAFISYEELGGKIPQFLDAISQGRHH